MHSLKRPGRVTRIGIGTEADRIGKEVAHSIFVQMQEDDSIESRDIAYYLTPERGQLRRRWPPLRPATWQSSF